MNHRCLGKKPARDAIKLRLASFAAKRKLPTPPKSYGHEGLIGREGWLMLGNDKYGNCVPVGRAHEVMMHSRIVGKPVMFNTPCVNADYGAVTGFNPMDAGTDNGTDMQEFAEYSRKVGIVDASGDRHKVAAYLALDPGNSEELWIALYLFGSVGIGLRLPDTAMDQNERKEPWVPVAGAHNVGGHYVSLVGRHYGDNRVVTWGGIQSMSDAFLKKYCDEAVAYVLPESLVHQRSPEGFAYAELIAALKQLGT